MNIRTISTFAVIATALLLAPAALALPVPISPPVPPVNDAFATSIPATPAGAGWNTGATTEAGEPTSCGWAQSGATVWYTFVVPAAGNWAIDTFGSNYDTVLGVYTGDSVNALSMKACNDDSGSLQSRVVVSAAAGDILRIQIGGYYGSQGNIVYNVNQA